MNISPSCLLWVALAGFGFAGARPPAPVSPAPPKGEAATLDPAALQGLADEVMKLVAAGRLAGVELLVLDHRKVALQACYGYKDLEARIPLEKDTLFNIRSMTKPLTALAVQMLIDEGRCAESDPVSRFIPEFGHGPGAGITIEHLLTHRSGLPLSLVSDFTRFPDLQAIAAEAARTAPLFSPGSGFHYSDTGADLLALVVERAAGIPFGQFVQERILDPLEMASTFAFLAPGDPRASRIAPAYAGGTGRWARYWTPDQGPLYKYQMGSQSLHSTPRDYARFLALLLDRGKAGGKPLVSARAWQHLTRPVSDFPQNQGFSSGVRTRYGQMLQLLVPAGRPEGPAVAFGHGGSDGTVAWAWPDRDLMVLVFTQSRGHTASWLIDDAVTRWLLEPESGQAAKTTFGHLAGRYLDPFGPTGLEEDEMIVGSDRLALDIPGQGVFALELPDAGERFRLSGNPAVWLTFARDEGGAVAGLFWHEGGKEFFLPRAGTAAALQLREKTRLAREQWKKFAGAYRTEQPGVLVRVVWTKDGLGVIPGGQSAALPLLPPDEQGHWKFQANPGLSVSFQENERGDVVSLTAHLPGGGTVVRPREPLPEAGPPGNP